MRAGTHARAPSERHADPEFVCLASGADDPLGQGALLTGKAYIFYLKTSRKLGFFIAAGLVQLVLSDIGVREVGAREIGAC